MSGYIEQMIDVMTELDADGIDFIEIGEFHKNIPCVCQSYTKEEFKDVNIIPKTCYRYYKIVDGKKIYVG